MAKGYQTQELKQKLVELLKNSKTGLSGIEISEKIGVNRVTMTKYLNIFATEGMIRQKNIGNVNLWFIEEGTEQYDFPDDYFRVKTIFEELLTTRDEQKVYNLIKNCISSNANPAKIINEIIVPSIETIQHLFTQGKISKSEEKFLSTIISRSIQFLNFITSEPDLGKNAIVISADPKSVLLSEAASAAYNSQGWKVSLLGDMSSAIDALLDLDLQKFLGKVWSKKDGVMIIVIFSDSEEGLNFFSQAVNSVKGKLGKNLFLILCGKIKKKTLLKADLITDNLDTALQWSQTKYESKIS